MLSYPSSCESLVQIKITPENIRFYVNEIPACPEKVPLYTAVPLFYLFGRFNWL